MVLGFIQSPILCVLGDIYDVCVCVCVCVCVQATIHLHLMLQLKHAALHTHTVNSPFIVCLWPSSEALVTICPLCTVHIQETATHIRTAHNFIKNYIFAPLALENQEQSQVLLLRVYYWRHKRNNLHITFYQWWQWYYLSMYILLSQHTLGQVGDTPLKVRTLHC